MEAEQSQGGGGAPESRIAAFNHHRQYKWTFLVKRASNSQKGDPRRGGAEAVRQEERGGGEVQARGGGEEGEGGGGEEEAHGGGREKKTGHDPETHQER